MVAAQRILESRNLYRPLQLHGNGKCVAMKNRRMNRLQRQPEASVCRPARIMAADPRFLRATRLTVRSRRTLQAGYRPPARHKWLAAAF